MSVQLLPFIDAPTLQIGLNQIYETNPSEPSPEVQFLASSINTNRVLETNIAPGNGHIRSVQVVYTPRVTEGEVDTDITADCSDGGAAGDLSHTYTLDTNVGVQYKETVALADLKSRLETDPDYFARRTMAIMDVVRRRLSTGVASQMALLAGRFASDNGEKNLSSGNYLKTVATKYAASVDGGKPNPEAIQEIAFSALNSGFIGQPYVFGYGEIYRYMQLMGAMGTWSDSGLDFVKFVQAQGVVFLPSFRIHSALNSGSGNNFLAVDAGAIHLLQYNKFDSPSAKVRDNSLVMDVIVDPMTGLSFNYKFRVDPCGEKVTIQISTSYSVVGLPDDMYAGGDRLEETNGVLEFAITNS